MLSCISPIIGDFNAEGLDSVESEDFDPGFGCVPVTVERKPNPLPPVILASEADMAAYYAEKMSEEERHWHCDQHLKRHGL